MTIGQLIEKGTISLDTPVVGRLPITKDGAITTEPVWWIDPDSGDFVKGSTPKINGMYEWREHRRAAVIDAYAPADGRPRVCMPLCNFYSSLEACEAAEAARSKA